MHIEKTNEEIKRDIDKLICYYMNMGEGAYIRINERTLLSYGMHPENKYECCKILHYNKRGQEIELFTGIDYDIKNNTEFFDWLRDFGK